MIQQSTSLKYEPSSELLLITAKQLSQIENCTQRYLLACLRFRIEQQCSAVMRSSSEEGSYLRLVDCCITQLTAESNNEEKRREAQLRHGDALPLSEKS